LVYAPVQNHSHKPEEQYAIIERCSPGPYLELFARRCPPGWDAWGDQVDSDVAL
jgi:N6-adenosine-specific RNA methylase IME4